MSSALDDALLIVDAIPEACARVGSDFRFTFGNRAAEHLLGISRAELLDKPAWEVCRARPGVSLEAAFRRATATHTTVSLEGLQIADNRPYAITAIPDSRGGLILRFADSPQRSLQQALQECEEKFAKAFQASPAPMCIVDIDGNARFLAVNDAFADITGYQREELIGRTSAELGLYCDPGDLAESRRRIVREGGYRNVEIRFRRKNGDILIGLMSAESIEIDGAFCAIAFAVDVTDERRAQQALRESEELYRQLFEVESDALLLLDQESGKLLAANRAATRLYGYTREELLSKNRTDLSAEPELTLRACTEMQNFTPVRWHKRKDGTIFQVEISSCYFDLKGRTVSITAIRDISDRRLMELALRKSEEKFHKAFQSNPAAIAIADLKSHKYIEVNGSFQALTGYSRDEMAGRSWDEVSLWVDHPHRDKSLALLMQEGKLLNCEFQFRRKDGVMRTGLLSAELLEIEGRPCAIAATVDVTDRLRLEASLRQAQKLESVGRLAGGVAHDFNNLLTIINGYSEIILKATHSSDPVHLHAQEIKKAGTRAAGLTAQLLAFSRKQMIQPKPLDVNVIVTDADRMLRRLIGEDIRLTTSLDPELGQVMADSDQIHQVIMNLVVNARDAMPDGGELKIATGNVDLDASAVAAFTELVPGPYIMLTVSDSGIGMSEETKQNVFEPFFTTKEQGAGTGLGLATVYGIVRQSGGWIDVLSTPGQGSKFRIFLPRVETRAAADQPGAGTAMDMSGEETVLLVEDQEEVRKYVVAILESYGYRVLEATDGDQASVIAQKHDGSIDLLLTDVIMPGMNGKDLADQIRRSRPKLKVIFMSGYPADMIARRGVLEQDVAYLPKPFNPDSLATKVREVLSRPAHPRPKRLRHKKAR